MAVINGNDDSNSLVDLDEEHIHDEDILLNYSYKSCCVIAEGSQVLSRRNIVNLSAEA